MRTYKHPDVDRTVGVSVRVSEPGVGVGVKAGVAVGVWWEWEKPWGVDVAEPWRKGGLMCSWGLVCPCLFSALQL
jgi:hypothetical protein